MPVMDGYEATRQLRNVPQHADLPIIALTAGAFKAQRNAAQEAGMDAFVSKPFNVEELIETIQRLTHTEPKTLLQDISDEAHSTGTLQTIPDNLPGIAIDQGMLIWNEFEVYCKYLHKFRIEHLDFIAHLESCLASGNMEGSRTLLHKLKGSAANLALTEVTKIVFDIEAMETNTDYTGKLQQLQQSLRTAFDSIATLPDTSVMVKSARFATPPISNHNPE